MDYYQPRRMRFGSFIAPYHAANENPTLALERDMQLVEHLDALGFDEAWIGEHHSAGLEIISSPELFIAGVAPRTKQIRFGTGVNSLTYHQPMILADRIVQLDHQLRGRLIFGAGPGQLPTDAYMLGIDSMQQRRMMNESLECLIELFAGNVVTRETDWFTLREARLQLLPYQDKLEAVVACAVTPTGPSTAGRLGLGMLSLAVSTAIGFNALGEHWEVYEETAKRHDKTVHRDSWRVVVNMHIAETREQAHADLEWGIMDIVRYIRTVRGNVADDDSPIGRIRTAEDAVKLMTTDGMGTFGIAMAGTPDDAIAYIEKLQRQSGGFGSFLFLAHNCANFEATKKSYELFARYVTPYFHGSNRNREASMQWASDRSSITYGGIVDAMKQAIKKYDEEKTKD
jgi:limonene 1,2-monooxygenase